MANFYTFNATNEICRFETGLSFLFNSGLWHYQNKETCPGIS